jgi:hypothetical protein
MKLATGATKNSRNDIRERQRRDRAAAQPLRALYPDVATLRLDFRYSADITPLPAPQSHVMHPPANAYFNFPCPYSECAGHFDLSQVVGELLRSDGSSAHGKLECCGERIHPQGRARCRLQLDYSLAVARGAG